MSDSEEILDQMIAIQRRALRNYFIFAVGLIVLGVVLVVVASLLLHRLNKDLFREIFRIGGGFVSSLGLFQIKEILARRERIEACRTLRDCVGLAGEDQRRRIESTAWELIEKMAAR